MNCFPAAPCSKSSRSNRSRSSNSGTAFTIHSKDSRNTDSFLNSKTAAGSVAARTAIAAQTEAAEATQGAAGEGSNVGLTRNSSRHRSSKATCMRARFSASSSAAAAANGALAARSAEGSLRTPTKPMLLLLLLRGHDSKAFRSSTSALDAALQPLQRRFREDRRTGRLPPSSAFLL